MMTSKHSYKRQRKKEIRKKKEVTRVKMNR
jgi:hypothetical protein